MLFVLQRGREEAMMMNKFFKSGVSITDAHPLNQPGHINRTLVGHMIGDPGRKIHDCCLFCLWKRALALTFVWGNWISKAGSWMLQIFQNTICSKKSPLTTAKTEFCPFVKKQKNKTWVVIFPSGYYYPIKGAGEAIFDQVNRLILHLLWVIFNIYVSSIKWQKSSVTK